MREEFAIKGNDNPLFAMFAGGCPNITVKVNSTHDSVATLFVNDRLDRFAVVRDSFVRSVDIWFFLWSVM